MDNNAVIRVVASIRTDLNEKVLALSTVAALPMDLAAKESVELACGSLESAVASLNGLILLLGGKP